MIKLGIYAICLSLLAPTSASAIPVFDTGNDLYETCSGSGISPGRLFCLAVASAYFDMMLALGYSCALASRTRAGLNREHPSSRLTPPRGFISLNGRPAVRVR